MSWVIDLSFVLMSWLIQTILSFIFWLVFYKCLLNCFFVFWLSFTIKDNVSVFWNYNCLIICKPVFYTSYWCAHAHVDRRPWTVKWWYLKGLGDSEEERSGVRQRENILDIDLTKSNLRRLEERAGQWCAKMIDIDSTKLKHERVMYEPDRFLWLDT